MDRIEHDIAARLAVLLSHLGAEASESTSGIESGIRAYSELKGRVGGADIAESLGVSKEELSAFERDLRDLGRRTQRATAEDEPVVVRNRQLAALMVLSWFEMLGERGLELPAVELGLGEENENFALKQVRALELLLRAVITDSFGSQESLEQELLERFGNKAVEGWKRSGDPGDLLSGTTMGEVASLVSAKQMFPRYSHLFEVGDALAFLPDRRKSLQRFLEDVRRIRNVLAHNRRISSVQIQLLDHYYSEVTSPLQESHDLGELAVNPSHFLDVTSEELGVWLEGLDESVQAVRDDVDDLRKEVGERFDALESTAGKTLEAATDTGRKATWILAGVVILAVGMWAVLRKADKIESATAELTETAAEMTRAGEAVREEIGQIGEAVAELAGLGGLIASPKLPEEFIHNARTLTASADYAGARKAYECFLEFDVPLADVAEEYVDVVVAAEGEQLALPILVRHLDPSGNRLALEDGHPVRREHGGSITDAAVAVELAMVRFLGEREQRLEWLESLHAIRPEYAPLLATLIRYHISPASLMTGPGSFDQDLFMAMPTRRAVGLAREWTEQFVTLDSGRTLESCYLDVLRAREAREYVATVRKELAALTDEYWGGQVAMHATVRSSAMHSTAQSRGAIGSLDGVGSSIQVMFRVPENVMAASLQVGADSAAVVLEIRKSRETSPGHWESLIPTEVFDGSFHLPYWTTCVVPMLNADQKHVLPATAETRQFVLRYVDADGQEADPIEFSLDCGSLLLAAAKDGLEGSGVFRVQEFGVQPSGSSAAFSVQNPGVDYGASLMLSPEEERGRSSRILRGRYPHWSPDAELHLPYLKTLETKDWARDGFGFPWVKLLRRGRPHEPITLRFDRLQFFKGQLRSVRYSLGDDSLDQTLKDSIDQTLKNSLYQQPWSIGLPDCLGGPLFVQVEYKDGSTSQVARYDLIDPETVSDWRAGGLEEEGYGTLVLREYFPDGAVRKVTRFRKSGPIVPGTTHNGEALAQSNLLHGLQQEFHPNGQLASEALCAEGVPYAKVEWSEDGALRLLSCAAPVFGMATRFGDSMLPGKTLRFGPYLKVSAGGEFDPESGWYGQAGSGAATEHMVQYEEGNESRFVDLTIYEGDTVKWPWPEEHQRNLRPRWIRETGGSFQFDSDQLRGGMSQTFDSQFLAANPRVAGRYEYEGRNAYGEVYGSITVVRTQIAVHLEPLSVRDLISADPGTDGWPTTERLSPLDPEEISRFQALTSVEDLLTTRFEGVGLSWRRQKHGWWSKSRLGALSREGWLRDGSRIGNWTEYYTDGAVRSRGGYAESEVGFHVTWDEDGQVDYEASGFMVRGELCVPRGHADYVDRQSTYRVVIDHGGADPQHPYAERSETSVYKAPVPVLMLYPEIYREGVWTPPGLMNGLPIYLAADAADPDVRKWWREVVDAEIKHRGWDPSPHDR